MPPNSRLARQRNQFFRWWRRAAGAYCSEVEMPHGPIAHGVADAAPSCAPVRPRWAPVAVSNHHAAHLGGAHVAGQVDPMPCFRRRAKYFAEGPPGGLDAVVAGRSRGPPAPRRR